MTLTIPQVLIVGTQAHLFDELWRASFNTRTKELRMEFYERQSVFTEHGQVHPHTYGLLNFINPLSVRMWWRFMRKCGKRQSALRRILWSGWFCLGVCVAGWSRSSAGKPHFCCSGIGWSVESLILMSLAGFGGCWKDWRGDSRRDYSKTLLLSV